MKPLIAIITCHRFKSRANAQRNTWIPGLKKLGEKAPDYKFFLGQGGLEPEEDEVFLDVPDDYVNLPLKTRAVMKWARSNGYDTVFKCDDDTYVFPERLIAAYPTTLYEGRLNDSQQAIAPHGWCSGFAYWLSGEAINIIASADEPDHKAEDLWVGKTLSRHDIKCKRVDQFLVLHLYAQQEWHKFKNQIIAACEFPDGLMYRVHEIMNVGPPISDPVVVCNQPNPRLARRVLPLSRFGGVTKKPGWPH